MSTPNLRAMFSDDKVKAMDEAASKQVQKHDWRNPLWKGPYVDGITFSLLCKYLVCRERFRCLVIDGIKPREGFNHRIFYGNLWHICEEEHAKGIDPLNRGILSTHAQEVAERYPLHQEQVKHWYNVCKVQFPLYREYWKNHPDVLKRRNVCSEKVFEVMYPLPSGRIVKLKGKWDSLDEIQNSGGHSLLFLQENKVKGDINITELMTQLASGFDLQTMMYLVCLEKVRADSKDDKMKSPIGGVRYNVVRRPLSGGKGTIVRHKPTKKNPSGESEFDFYQRVSEVIKEDPKNFFYRFKVDITKEDIRKFRTRCLDPLLEGLCSWYNAVTTYEYPTNSQNGIHWMYPYGVYNPLTEGGMTAYDNYIINGTFSGMTRLSESAELFPELEV